MKNSIFLLILASCFSFFFSNCARPTLQSTTLSPQQKQAIDKLEIAELNKKVVRQWFEEGWNQRATDSYLAKCFHQDWKDGYPILPGQADGLEGMQQLVKTYLKAFPDIQFNLTHVFADARYTTVRFEVNATHQGEIFGMSPTGKNISSTGIIIYEMKDGKIITSWQEFDLLGLMTQLQSTLAGR